MADGLDALNKEKIEVSPLRPANCGFAVQWTDIFSERFAGQPLKRIALLHEGEMVRGEAVIAHYGLEGGGDLCAVAQTARDDRKIRRSEARSSICVPT